MYLKKTHWGHFKDLLTCMCVPEYMCIMCVHCPWKSGEGIGFPKLELQAVSNYLVWVMATEPWSSGKAASALNLGTISSPTGII